MNLERQIVINTFAWARIVLAVLLGGIGTLSLVIDPVKWILEGNYLEKALYGMTLYSILFGISRMVHLASVIIAFILMFRPAANKYYRAAAQFVGTID